MPSRRDNTNSHTLAQGPKFPLGGLTKDLWKSGLPRPHGNQCLEGGVQRPSSSTDLFLSRSCERGQSRIVLFLYRQRQQTHGFVPLRASKLISVERSVAQVITYLSYHSYFFPSKLEHSNTLPSEAQAPPGPLQIWLYFLSGVFLFIF